MKCPCCGYESTSKAKPRSVEQLRRFFAVLRAMYQHWPEQSDFQPESEEHLRKWVLCKAGHREATDVSLPFAEDQPAVTRLAAMSIEAAVRGSGGFAFIRPHPEGGLVRVYRARSIAFDKMEHGDFCALNDEVEQIYKAETGLDPEQVLAEQERAA